MNVYDPMMNCEYMKLWWVVNMYEAIITCEYVCGHDDLNCEAIFIVILHVNMCNNPATLTVLCHCISCGMIWYIYNCTSFLDYTYRCFSFVVNFMSQVNSSYLICRLKSFLFYCINNHGRKAGPFIFQISFKINLVIKYLQHCFWELICIV